jgi:hypothetical protein
MNSQETISNYTSGMKFLLTSHYSIISPYSSIIPSHIQPPHCVDLVDYKNKNPPKKKQL